MALSKEEIKRIATLARVHLTPEEEQRHAETISAVLGYVEMLNEIDTKKIKSTVQVTGLSNVIREDKPIVSLCKKELIAEMPKTKAGLLQVPGIFKNEDNAH